MLFRLALNAISHRFPLHRYALLDTERAIRDRVRSGGSRDGKAATAWDREEREEHNVFFVNKSYHQQREGWSMVVWSTDDSCFLVEGRTCARSSPNPMLSCSPGWQHLPFFGHSRISTEQLIRTSRYLSEKPVSLNQGTSLFPLHGPGQNITELLKV